MIGQAGRTGPPAGEGPSQIQIREVETEEEGRQCVALQQEVWGFDRRDLVTAPMLATCRRYGGIVLGAFLPGGQLVGFVFSLPAPWKDGLLQHSHMLAVRPPFRNQGLGFRLKQAQYEAARSRGIPLITWTFDPLEAKNAYLNLGKLGAVARRYYIHLYGERTSSELHSGLGTDRLLAEWRVCGPFRPPVAPSPGAGPFILQGKAGRGGWLRPQEVDLQAAEPCLWLEIPPDIQSLKRADRELALEWREKTRQAFLHYLLQGYRVQGIHVEGTGGQIGRVAYRLLREAENREGYDED